MWRLKFNESTAALRRVPVILVDTAGAPVLGYTASPGNGKIKVSKNGAAEANHAGTLVERAGGRYYYECHAGEVDTKGYLTIAIVDAGAGLKTYTAGVQVGTDPYNDSALTSRSVGERDSGTLRSATDNTAQLKAGSKTPQPGNTFEIMSGALEGASSNVAANSWNAGTETLALDPPIVGLNGTTPDYRLLTGTAAPTTDPIDVELNSATRAALITEFYSFLVTTITTPNSAAQKLTAAGSLGDPMANAAAGYAAGSLGAKINAIPASPAAVGNIPTSGDILAAIKADVEWKTMLANVNGQMTYDPATGVVLIRDKTGSIIRVTHTLTLDGQGRVTVRASS